LCFWGVGSPWGHRLSRSGDPVNSWRRRGVPRAPRRALGDVPAPTLPAPSTSPHAAGSAVLTQAQKGAGDAGAGRDAGQGDEAASHAPVIGCRQTHRACAACTLPGAGGSGVQRVSV
jgi:hypothetical protein